MVDGIRVAVTGATGNIGTSVVRVLGSDDRVGSILGIARRPAEWQAPKFELRTACAKAPDCPRRRSSRRSRVAGCGSS